jgi:peptidoglycan/xylan/chitin deacetylase (PgdA/CDA1 family)
MLKRVKLLTLKAAKSLGVFELFLRSRWRKNRLLILGYHGISQDDEHLWNPELYMTSKEFRARMMMCKELGCNVLRLEDALQKLYAGNLPERSLVLTFDDGCYSFYQKAFPVIKELDWPVTVYLTSYYSNFNRPVFDVMCSYLLWKGSNRIIDGDEFIKNGGRFDLSRAAERSAAALAIRSFASENRLSGIEKDALLISLADRLDVDYEAILSKRILHILSPNEIARLGAEGVDIQLHTHRHCSPSNHQFFLRELEDNRRFIKEFTNISASHFCYPSGMYKLQCLPWLHESNVISATTCEPGLVKRNTNPLTLPRFLDTRLLHPVEFEGWLCGFSSLLPRGPLRADTIIKSSY